MNFFKIILFLTPRYFATSFHRTLHLHYKSHNFTLYDPVAIMIHYNPLLNNETITSNLTIHIKKQKLQL
jgi:hypothetical protein